jgi:hypothetical protein
MVLADLLAADLGAPAPTPGMPAGISGLSGPRRGRGVIAGVRPVTAANYPHAVDNDGITTEEPGRRVTVGQQFLHYCIFFALAAGPVNLQVGDRLPKCR